jgi:deoxyribonuclease V
LRSRAHESLPHRWDLTPREAIALQQRLRGQIVVRDDLPEVKYVAGVDVGFEQENRVTRAAVAVLTFPQLDLVDRSIERVPTQFPYVPGLLSFREAPAVLRALQRLKITPDLILYDGQGIAHPRRIGIASHVGLLSGIPSIGVAKTRLIGTHEEAPNARGGWTPLWDGAEQIGALLRTKVDCKPLYVSVGHRISLATALRYVLSCVTKYRLPETTRWAHHLASTERGESDAAKAIRGNARQTTTRK